jgi:hypothetical protein
MSMLHHLFIFVIFLLAPSCQPSFAQTPITQIVHAEPSATVATLFSSTNQDGATLHFPDCAHFRYSYNQKALKSERLFYATNTCRMPMQSFIQFMQNGHALFQNRTTRRTYRTAVIKAVRAQRQVNFKPTARAHQRLSEAKNDIMNLLQSLPLSDAKIRISLEKIFSIKPPSVLNKLNSSLKSVLKGFGALCAVILWIPFCCIIGAVLTDNGSTGGFGGMLFGLEFGVYSLLGFGIYQLYRAFKYKKRAEHPDLFDHDQIMPVTIRIELTPAVSVELTHKDTLDLTTTST